MIYRRFRNIALFFFEICALKICRKNRVAYFRGVAMEAMSLPPHFNFLTKKRSNISVSKIRDIAFYGCSEIPKKIMVKVGSKCGH